MFEKTLVIQTESVLGVLKKREDYLSRRTQGCKNRFQGRRKIAKMEQNSCGDDNVISILVSHQKIKQITGLQGVV